MRLLRLAAALAAVALTAVPAAVAAKTTDAECPSDSCDATTRRCALSRKTCDPNDPSACSDPSSRIYCTNIAGSNGCVIGRNCVPLPGLSCADVPR